jgi:PAS domain S-box-containing protein
MTRGRNGDQSEARLKLRLTEDSLRESEQRSRLATEATGVGIWEWNVKTNFIRWDRQMFAIYGIPPTQDGFVNYDIWAASVVPEDLAEQAELLQRHAREGGINRREFRLRRRDNQEIRIIQAVETVRADSAGDVEWVVGTNLDVTERKRAEEALHESDKRLRLALSGAKAAAWQWNILTNELIWSPESSEIYGRDPERDMARYETWRDCLHPDDLETTERLIRDIIQQRASDFRAQYRVVLPSGEVRWLASLGKIDYAANGAPLRMSGINLDITEQKRAEQQLTESEMRFRAAQEASLDGFLIFEPVRGDDGRIADLMVVYVNPMAAQYCLSTPERMEGRLLSETLPGVKLPGGMIETHGRIIESGRTQEYVLEYDADGVKGHFRNLVAPFGRYTAATFRDITALVEGNKALATAKAEAERANLKMSRFLAAASHDLRQPVQSLLLLLSVIERQVADQPKTVEVAGMMRMAVDGLHGLLNSVLDISRLDAGVVAPLAECVDLGEIISKFAAEYEPKAASMALELRCIPRNLQVRTDPTLLGRALRNLIENALRYTQKGGVLLAVRRRGAFARIDVIDTGVGIPADKLSEIFEEFHQLHNPGRNLEQGLGLGLAIVRRLAELLGTEVDVASRLGRGARFSLTLPLYQQAPPVAVSGTGVDDPGGRVLIIEDNAIVRHGLEILLNQLGYETFLANSGEQALQLSAKEKSRFDAIVTDQRLGDGLTGIETAREIHRRAARAIPTLVLTGDTGRERIAEIETSGFPILHKPVDAEDLRSHLARLIERAAVGG